MAMGGTLTTKEGGEALGLRIGFMGRQCVSDDVRLNAFIVGFTCFQSNQIVCL